MARTAFQFPGQGSQYVGMGRSFHASSSVARDLFARAEDILAMPLTSLCFEGTDDELRRTENAQPAIFTVSAIAHALVGERGIEPVAAAGHSVGEYAALLAAGALSFEDGLRAVRRRGELMAGAAGRTPGIMAAVIGLPVGRVETLCERARAMGVVGIANENGPSQTVVSGEPNAVEHVLDLADGCEGCVSIPLSVAGAFHSDLMTPIVAEMADVIEALPLRAARIPVIANVSGAPVRTPAEIRNALIRQIDGRVRWGASIACMAGFNVDRFVEVGPGRKLTRLVRDLVVGLDAVSAEELLAPFMANAAR